MAALIVSLSLNPIDDADILEWLAKQPNKSQAIRDTIRKAIAQNEPTMADVLHKLDQLLDEREPLQGEERRA